MSNQFGMYSEQYNNDYSKEQNEQFTAAFDAITQQFGDFQHHIFFACATGA